MVLDPKPISVPPCYSWFNIVVAQRWRAFSRNLSIATGDLFDRDATDTLAYP